MSGENVSNYKEQGGARDVIGGSLDVVSGGDIDIESGASLKIAGVQVTTSAAELNAVDITAAGTAQANKAAVLGANKNLDTLVIADSGLKLGAGAGTAVTATAAQLNRTAVTTAGTVEASKVLVVGANKNVDTLAIADGGLKLGAGAGTAVTAVAAELNKLDGAPLGVSWTVGTEGTNTVDLVCQLQDWAGADIAVRGSVDIYLSEDANGDSIVTTAPDGGWAILTDGLLIPVVANKYARFVSESDGDIGIRVTESGTKTVYAIAILPTGKLVPSAALTFAA